MPQSSDLELRAWWHEAETGFIESWERTEKFYVELGQYPGIHDSVSDMLRLVRELRKLELDRRLRAGTSMTTLMLSRSLKHGLRDDQSLVSVTWCGTKEHGARYELLWTAGRTYFSETKSRVIANPLSDRTFEHVLAWLLHKPID